MVVNRCQFGRGLTAQFVLPLPTLRRTPRRSRATSTSRVGRRGQHQRLLGQQVRGDRIPRPVQARRHPRFSPAVTKNSNIHIVWPWWTGIKGEKVKGERRVPARGWGVGSPADAAVAGASVAVSSLGRFDGDSDPVWAAHSRFSLSSFPRPFC